MQLKLCEHKNLHSQISREKKKDYKRIKINGKGHLNRSRRQKGTLKGTVGHKAVVGTGAGLAYPPHPHPAPPTVAPVCWQPCSCSRCHALTRLMALSNWGQGQQWVREGLVPSAGVSTRQDCGAWEQRIFSNHQRLALMTTTGAPPWSGAPTHLLYHLTAADTAMFRSLPPAADAFYVPRTPPGGQHTS
uniref:Uncharacterized protein n=1 Tax=Myotis myotis TaxID=51298 RepID=A0A7J7WVR5_MYOMY|nr:hypothetical protein mMyoMyo1_011906 [Myotis myotis]